MKSEDDIVLAHVGDHFTDLCHLRCHRLVNVILCHFDRVPEKEAFQGIYQSLNFIIDSLRIRGIRDSVSIAIREETKNSKREERGKKARIMEDHNERGTERGITQTKRIIEERATMRSN